MNKLEENSANLSIAPRINPILNILYALKSTFICFTKIKNSVQVRIEKVVSVIDSSMTLNIISCFVDNYSLS